MSLSVTSTCNAVSQVRCSSKARGCDILPPSTQKFKSISNKEQLTTESLLFKVDRNKYSRNRTFVAAVKSRHVDITVIQVRYKWLGNGAKIPGKRPHKGCRQPRSDRSASSSKQRDKHGSENYLAIEVISTRIRTGLKYLIKKRV